MRHASKVNIDVEGEYKKRNTHLTIYHSRNSIIFLLQVHCNVTSSPTYTPNFCHKITGRGGRGFLLQQLANSRFSLDSSNELSKNDARPACTAVLRFVRYIRTLNILRTEETQVSCNFSVQPYTFSYQCTL